MVQVKLSCKSKQLFAEGLLQNLWCILYVVFAVSLKHSKHYLLLGHLGYDHPRYGFDLQVGTGRACDIATHSKKCFRVCHHIFFLRGAVLVPPEPQVANTWPFKRQLRRHSRFITANYPDRCMFSDILDFIKDTSQPPQKWKPAASHVIIQYVLFLFQHLVVTRHILWLLYLMPGTLNQVPALFCQTHNKNCPRKLQVEKNVDKAAVDGPPCVLFSLPLWKYRSISFC